MMCWCVNSKNEPFRKLHDKAAYLGKVDRLPLSYRQATKQEAILFDERLELLWEYVQDNMNLIYHMAKKFPHKIDCADAVGLTTLIAAAAGYDPSLGIKFSTYACTALYRAYSRYPTPTIIDVIDQPITHTFELDNKDELKYILNKLDEFDRCLLTLRYLLNVSLDEIGQTMGLVKSTIHYHIAQALRRAKDVWAATERT